MAYDLLIKNGRIVDGSGMPSFRAMSPSRTARSPRSANCRARPIRPSMPGSGRRAGLYRQSLPLRCAGHLGSALLVLVRPRRDHGRVRQLLAVAGAGAPGQREARWPSSSSYVEAIPMEVLNTVEVDWETIPQYMDRLDRNLGVNVGKLIGHSTVRYYVMGDESQKRTATEDEIKAMQDVVRDGMKGGALGLSVSRNKGHYDPQGVHIPALWADEKEIFALGDVLRETRHRHHPVRRRPRRRAQGRADGAPVGGDRAHRHLQQSRPERARVPAPGRSTWRGSRRPRRRASGPIRCAARTRRPRPSRWRTCQVFRGSPTWHPILLASDDEKLRAYADPGGAAEAARGDGRGEGRDPGHRSRANGTTTCGSRSRLWKRTRG